MFTLRLAAPDHAEEIAGVYVRTRRAAYATFFPPEALAAMSVDVEAARWRERIADDASETVLALDADGAIGGFTHVSWRNAGMLATGEIEYMYVATEHQGNGLGALLMTEAETRLAGRRCHDAVLWVYEANTPARGFYERCGWQDDGARRTSESVSGQQLARYRKRPLV